MEISFRQADISDAELLVSIYNAAFYGDYIKYGECPAYGRTVDSMEQSVRNYPKFIISCDGTPVGCISCKETEKGIYEIGCLCVVPEYQGRGIGTAAVRFAKEHYNGWKKFTLITPSDKAGNIKFYTEKCGFHIVGNEADGNVEVVRLAVENEKG